MSPEAIQKQINASNIIPINKLIALDIATKIGDKYPITAYRWSGDGVGLTINKSLIKTALRFNQNMILIEAGEAMTGFTIRLIVNEEDMGNPDFNPEVLIKSIVDLVIYIVDLRSKLQNACKEIKSTTVQVKIFGENI